MKKNLIRSYVAIFVATLSVVACTKKEDNSNKILLGEYGSMTGEVANFGQSTHKGITLAQEQYNAAGGFNGKQVEVKICIVFGPFAGGLCHRLSNQ